MAEKVVGILGGMGPESTAALYLEIIRRTPVTVEQDHLRIVIDSNPKIPDRTAALLSGDAAPVIRLLAESARTLERAGAELIGIPCNTAHAFLPAIRAAVAVPVLDMVDEAAWRARETFGDGAVVGLLTTDGTLHARLYHEALARHGLECIAPREDAQRGLMAVLADVKRWGVAPESLRRLKPAIAQLTADGATVLIAGCTEISLVLAAEPPAMPWLDPLQVLAERLIQEATRSR